ncbi:MAG: hypothetical protein K6G91_08460 [Kiritimatiellae bacterium]|nr:hypothetical protein [Kiritimatiellia bacterium]
MKIKTKKQFKERVDAAFETQKIRDEAKACHDFSRVKADGDPSELRSKPPS